LGESNQKLAEGNKIRPRVIEASRGIITDSDGVWLARNKPDFVLVLYPSDLPKKKADREEVYKKVSEIAEMSVDEIRSQAEENGLLSLDAVTLKENILHDDALLLKKSIFGLQGVSVVDRSSREYVSLPGLGHILGYTGKISEDDLKINPDYYLSDKIGKAGLEAQYEEELKGKHGVEQIEVDSKGNIVRVMVSDGNREAIPGYNLSLYLDRGLQLATVSALQKGIDSAKELTETDVNAGVAIVMDVNTGGILSTVSLPDYNNNLFSTKISNEDYQNLINDKSNPLFDRTIKGTYPPGSIVKIVMAAAGLSEGTITANTSFNTPAEIKIGDFVFPDWKDHSYESTNVERAIAESNNVFFYSLGGGYDKIRGLGIDNMNKYWKLFGLGEPTGIDLPGEASGLLPNAEWKKKAKNESWYIGDTYHASIGQGDLLVTPIQMLRAVATVANGGKLLNPQIVQKIVNQKGTVIKNFGPKVERENFISQSVLKTVQEGMRMAVTEGSARSLNDLPVTVAGKTGTAQFLNNQKTHAWFECYAPYENPQIAVITMIEGGGGGHEIAAPIAKEILNYYFAR
jgi:penicillin-binding protein 2